MPSFQQLVDLLPEKHRSIQVEPSSYGYISVGECFFGAPADDRFGRDLLTKVPADTTEFQFLLGQGDELVEAYCHSIFPAKTTSLCLGCSTYYEGDYEKEIDYRNSVNSLSKVSFPNLKRLKLGWFEMFVNASGPYGFLGEISRLISEAPNLEELRICGNWTMEQPLDLSQLKYFEISTANTSNNEHLPTIDESSMDAFFHSEMPDRPDEFWLFFHDVEDCEIQHTAPIFYDLPSKFWNWKPHHFIDSFILKGCYTEASKSRFMRSHLKSFMEEENYQNSMNSMDTPSGLEGHGS